MNVRTICLAILNFGDTTGYEIRKMSLEGAYSHFVDASYGSIYPALSKLEADGKVTSREEVQPGRPARKVYSITESGREEFCNSLSTLPEKDIYRSEFLLMALCAELMTKRDVRSAINEQIRNMEEELAVIKDAAEENEMRGSDWVSGYASACLNAGLAYLRANRIELEAIAGSKDEVSEGRTPLIAAE